MINPTTAHENKLIVILDVTTIVRQKMAHGVISGVGRVTMDLIRILGEAPRIELKLHDRYHSPESVLRKLLPENMSHAELTNAQIEGKNLHEIKFSIKACYRSVIIWVKRLFRIDRLPSLQDALDSLPCIKGINSWLRNLQQSKRSVKLESFRKILETADIYLTPFDAPDPLIHDIPTIKVAQILHDLIPFRLKEYASALNLGTPLGEALLGIKPHYYLAAISEYTKRDWMEMNPNFPAHHIDVIHNSFDPKFASAGTNLNSVELKELYGVDLNTPYILSVSSIEPRKNLETLVKAFDAYCLASGDQNIRLVLAGAGSLAQGCALKKAMAESPFREQIIMTGFVKDSMMPGLMSRSLCFVYPSRYEGFGLPILEAMASGAPVICSNATSLPEVAGDAALTFDPDDYQALARCLKLLIQNPDERLRLIERGKERIQHFSYERYKEQLLRWLIKVKQSDDNRFC